MSEKPLIIPWIQFFLASNSFRIKQQNQTTLVVTELIIIIIIITVIMDKNAKKPCKNYKKSTNIYFLSKTLNKMARVL